MTSAGTTSSNAASPSGVASTPRSVRSNMPRACSDSDAAPHSGGALASCTASPSTYARRTAHSVGVSGSAMQVAASLMTSTVGRAHASREEIREGRKPDRHGWNGGWREPLEKCLNLMQANRAAKAKLIPAEALRAQRLGDP